MTTRNLSILLLAGAILVWACMAPRADGIPYLARKYKMECGACHVIPPKLNEVGEKFLANGYRFPGKPSVAKALPLSVWASWRGERDIVINRGRGIPNRVEIISAGPIGKSSAFYFVEWLPVSQQRNAANQRVQRHGRFEDLFVSVPLGRVQLTVGQYRQITQVDVSRRLSLSEPLAFSAGLAGPTALSGRLTSLRSFSLSGRSPAIRVSTHWRRGKDSADGWYALATVPLAGEFVIPLTEQVRRTQGFAFELRPKGVVLESYYRRGLNTIGAHAFLGDERRFFGLVGAVNRGPFFSTLALGFARERTGQRHTRISWENEWIPLRWMALGLRLDDRTGANRPVAVVPYFNAMFPLTSYTFRFTVEHRQQRGTREWLLELGAVF